MSNEVEDQELGKAELRRKLVMKRLEMLMQSNPQLYYEATTAVARAVHADITGDHNFEEAEKNAVSGLSVRDIEIILAFR